MEINQGLITIKDEKGDYLFSLKGKVRVETKLRDCERCNSVARKKELEALDLDRKQLKEDEYAVRAQRNAANDHSAVLKERESKLEAREQEIKQALKTLCKD